MKDTKNEHVVKKQSQWPQIWRRFRKNKIAFLGLIVCLAMIIIALLGDVIIDYDTQVVSQDIQNALQSPSKDHPLGTDQFGRDLLVRIIYGSRMSLFLGLVAMACAMFFGCILGSLAGFYGGMIDTVISRITDAFLSIPSLLMSLCIIAALGPSIINILLALTLSYVPSFMRVIRSTVMTLRGHDYIEAARAYGASDFRIICRYILPNAMGPIIVQGTMSIASIIISAASLGFMGMGIAPPMPEWGTMLSEGREFIFDSTYLVTFPGLAIVLACLCFNLLGDGLRDALDPRLKD